jgi:hypothetical protein
MYGYIEELVTRGSYLCTARYKRILSREFSKIRCPGGAKIHDIPFKKMGCRKESDMTLFLLEVFLRKFPSQ